MSIHWEIKLQVVRNRKFELKASNFHYTFFYYSGMTFKV